MDYDLDVFSFNQEIWYALQPMIVMSAVALTAGYGLLLDHPTDIPPTKKSIRGALTLGLLGIIYLGLHGHSAHLEIDPWSTQLISF